MAEYLASIFGTEKDKVNCSFFFKTGKLRKKGSIEWHILCCVTHSRSLYPRWPVLQDPQQAHVLPDGAPLQPLHQPPELGQDRWRLPPGQRDRPGDAGALRQLLRGRVCRVWGQVWPGRGIHWEFQSLCIHLTITLCRLRRWTSVTTLEIIWLATCM